MTNIIAGFIKQPRETNDRFPYVNSNGRLYSEIKGYFAPAAGSDDVESGIVVIKGTFDKDTYELGRRDGFQVVVYQEGSEYDGTPIYQADDRTNAYASVQSLELTEVLQTVRGIGETYSERLVASFNKKNDFFDALRKHLNGTEVQQCNVPKKAMNRVFNKKEEIIKALDERSIHEALFYNILNQHGMVTFKGQNSLPFQMRIKEWMKMYARINVVSPDSRMEDIEQLEDWEELLEMYGSHFLTLLLHPEYILSVYGSPMDSPMKREEKNVQLAHTIIDLANDELDPVDITRLGLEERGVLAYTFDVYLYMKQLKDGGYDNPHSGDTVFEIYDNRAHNAIQNMVRSKYDLSFEEVRKEIMSGDKTYPVSLFYSNDQLLGQFTQTYQLNKSIVRLIKERQESVNESFVDKDLYKEALDQVLADNRFELHEDQYNAIIGMNDYSMSVLTGGPGTGKTTILSVFLRTLSKVNNELFKQNAHSVVFCAPTGKAAKRMKESLNDYRDEYPMLAVVQQQTYTIHSFLLKHSETLEIASKAKEGSKWLVIDESSMVDEEMLEWILKKVPKSYRILIVGDEKQLPSIGPGRVLDDLLTLENVGTFNLTEPYRTTGTVMKNAYAIRGKEGEDRVLTLDDLIFDNSFSIMSYEDMIQLHKNELGRDTSFYQFVMQHVPDLYNRNMHSGWAASFLYKQLEEGYFNPDDSMVLMPFSNNTKDIQERVAVTQYNQSIQSLLQPFRDVLPAGLDEMTYDELLNELNDSNNNTLFDMNRTIHSRSGIMKGIGVNNSNIFRLGDRVLSIRNQYEVLTIPDGAIGPFSKPMHVLEELCGMWYARLQKEDLLVASDEAVMNGDVGTVRAVMVDGSIAVEFDDRDTNDWVYMQHNPDFKDSLALSYATTVHKSQGSEAETVVLFLSAENDTSVMNYRELLYTAITRAKKRVIIIGSKESLVESMNVQKNNRHTALSYLFDNAGIGKGRIK